MLSFIFHAEKASIINIKIEQKKEPNSTEIPSPFISQMSFASRSALPKNLEKVIVTRVIDGDTIVIQGGKVVRYIGINTPESVDPRRPVQCFGKEASRKNKELVEGQIVALEKDISNIDKYGRLLRYVYKGNVFINELLVSEGFAQVATYPPDIKYVEKFKVAEKEAREAKKGLWADGACGL